MSINFDLENSPLQIKTDSEVGSDEEVNVNFSSEGYLAGEVHFYFNSPPKYYLYYCRATTDFTTALPSETEKVWTITLSRVSGEIRVVIHCNDKEVLNVVLSDTTCSYSKYYWSSSWSREMDQIYFHPYSDTASDYYRPGTLNRTAA